MGPPSTSIADFLLHGGETGALIREYDWGSTALGRIEAWPVSLRTAIGLILRSPIPMVTLWGEDGVMIYNDAYSIFAGRRHPRLLGGKVREGWPEVAAFNDHVMTVGLAGGTLAYKDQELTLYRDGSAERVWMNLDYSPILDDSGMPAGVIAIVVETTERVRAETRLRALAETLEVRLEERTAERDRVWRNSRDLLVIIDAAGTFRAVNPAWTTILGHEPEDIVGRSFLEFVWPDDAAMTQGGLDTAVSKRDLTSFENRYRHRDGSARWLSWNTSLEGALVYAYGRDITAEKEQASALRLAEEKLRQSQKMEAVGQLTGGLAHDFNNLLTGITGNLDLLRERLSQGRLDTVDRYVGAAQDAARRAAALTHRLLAFSRQQTLDPKPTDINRLVAGLEELIRRTVGPAVTIDVRPATDLWFTLVDPNQLENALLNLCINARDAMPDGGRLTIETANTTLGDQDAAEHDLAPGQYLALRVVDSGTGMTPDVIDRAFDPFFTTKPLGQGTGLGLSMIYGFTRQSGGHAVIRSEVGRGTTICLYLPRYRGDLVEVQPPAGGLESAKAGAGETVLVVEDEPTVRMLVTEVLRERGYATIEAADGLSGLEVLRSDARIDLLVSDIGLPGGMNGRQVADAGRHVRPGLKVLFVTGYAEAAVLGRGPLGPDMQILTKPFAIDDLADRIAAMIASR